MADERDWLNQNARNKNFKNLNDFQDEIQFADEAPTSPLMSRWNFHKARGNHFAQFMFLTPITPIAYVLGLSTRVCADIGKGVTMFFRGFQTGYRPGERSYADHEGERLKNIQNALRSRVERLQVALEEINFSIDVTAEGNAGDAGEFKAEEADLDEEENLALDFSNQLVTATDAVFEAKLVELTQLKISKSKTKPIRTSFDFKC